MDIDYNDVERDVCRAFKFDTTCVYDYPLNVVLTMALSYAASYGYNTIECSDYTSKFLEAFLRERDIKVRDYGTIKYIP